MSIPGSASSNKCSRTYNSKLLRLASGAPELKAPGYHCGQWVAIALTLFGANSFKDHRQLTSSVSIVSIGFEGKLFSVL